MYFTILAEIVEDSSSLSALTEQLWLDETGNLYHLQKAAADHAFISKFCNHLKHNSQNILENLHIGAVQVCVLSLQSFST